MKIGKFYFAVATAEGGASSVATPVTSPKLDELKLQKKALWAEMIKFEDPDSQEAMDAKMAVWKIDNEITAEKTAIAKAEQAAKLAEQRNQRLALVATLLDAHAALITERAKKTPDAAKVAELETAFNTAREVVDNELLAKFASSSPGRKTSDKTAENGTPSGNSENKERILELARKGLKHKEIQEETGIARSTVWHTINNAKKAGETFPNV